MPLSRLKEVGELFLITIDSLILSLIKNFNGIAMM